MTISGILLQGMQPHCAQGSKVKYMNCYFLENDQHPKEDLNYYFTSFYSISNRAANLLSQVPHQAAL